MDIAGKNKWIQSTSFHHLLTLDWHTTHPDLACVHLAWRLGWQLFFSFVFTFISTAVARIMSVLPEKFQNFQFWEGGYRPPGPPARTPGGIAIFFTGPARSSKLKSFFFKNWQGLLSRIGGFIHRSHIFIFHLFFRWLNRPNIISILSNLGHCWSPNSPPNSAKLVRSIIYINRPVEPKNMRNSFEIRA